MRSAVPLFLALVAGSCGKGCSAPAPAPAPAAPEAAAPAGERAYRATIRWTGYGIPHVSAGDVGSLAYGQGYAFAALHACVLAEQVIRVRGERAEFFGPGKRGEHVESDFAFRSLALIAEAERELPGRSREVQDGYAGFAAGYNRYLRDTGVDDLPEECSGAPWVREVTAAEVAAHAVAALRVGSTGLFIDSIAAAAPPGAGEPAGAKSGATWPDLGLGRPRPASNGWALGADKTASGRGLLLANPHFPWEGELRFYEVHLTIPGELDVYGATLLGTPLVGIGFTEHLAWTHTWSTSTRFVLYRLALDPDDPTRYRYGREWRRLEPSTHAIRVRRPDGTHRTVERTLYRSHYGPVLGGGPLSWTGEHAFTIRDLAGSYQSFDRWLAGTRARSITELEETFARYGDTATNNTIAADRDGNVLFVDSSAVPDLSPGALAAWRIGLETMPELRAAWEQGVVVLDGSMPLFELARDPKAPVAGAIPYQRAPKLRRRDYVLNANDSYWLANPAAPIAKASPLYGKTGAPQSLRTRMNHRSVAGVERFTLEAARDAVLENRALSGELLRDAVVARCRRGGREVARACDTLAAWDGRYDLDSAGAVLWRELWGRLPGERWAEPFDPERPLETPRGLAPAPESGPDPVVQAIRGALDLLERAGLDPHETRLGDVQYAMRGTERIPVPGGPHPLGVMNMVSHPALGSSLLGRTDAPAPIAPGTSLTPSGYPVSHGTSFLLVVELGEAGPRAQAVMTYSASSDPASPHFADQTRLYARGELREVLLSEEAIRADPALRVQELEEP